MDAQTVITEDSGGIFNDAVFLSSHYSLGSVDTLSRMGSTSSNDLGMLVNNGVYLSPNEAEVFKKMQKIVAENKELKCILKDNSVRLQKHVDDCIQWKSRRNDIENGLRHELQAERQATAQLNAKLERLNAVLQETSTQSNQFIDGLMVQLNAHSKKLEALIDSNLEMYDGRDGAMAIQETARSTIECVKEFCFTRSASKLEERITFMENQFSSLPSTPNGNSLRETILSIRNSLAEYGEKTSSVNPQIPLAQFLQLQHQMEAIMSENFELKVHLDAAKEVETKNNHLQEEMRELVQKLGEKDRRIQEMAREMEELEFRSAEILDITPIQQPKEIKQLEENIEMYKSKIENLEVQNKRMQDDLDETVESFDKVEEQNAEYVDQIRELEDEIKKLKETKNQVDEAVSNYSKLLPLDERPKVDNSFEPNGENDKDINSLSNDFEIVKEENTQLKINIREKTEEVTKLMEELNLTENKLLEANKNLRDKEMESMNSTHSMEDVKKYNDESNITQHSEMIARKDKEIASLLKDINQHSEMIARKDKYINSLTIDIDQHAETVARKNNEIDSLSKDIDQYSDTITCRDKKIDSLSLDSKMLKDEISKLNNEILDLKGVLNEMANNSQECNRTRQELMSEMNFREKDLNEVKEKLLSKESELSNTAKLLASSEILCKENQVEYERKINRWKTREAKDADKINALKKEISELKGTLQKVTQEGDKSKSEIYLETKSINTDAEASSLEGMDSLVTVTDDDNECVSNQSKEKIMALEDLVGTLKDENAKLSENMVNLETQLRQSHEEHILVQSNMQKRLDQHLDLDEKFYSVSNKFESVALESKADDSRSELNFLKNQLETQQHNNEKLKKDAKDLLAKVKEITAQYEKTSDALARVNDLYTQSNNSLKAKDKELQEKNLSIDKMKDYIEDVPVLRTELRKKDQEINTMKGYLEEVPVLRMQLEVFQNDFQAERNAREKQQEDLLQQRERNNILMAENQRMREDIEQRGTQNLAQIQQRHTRRSLEPQRDVHPSMNAWQDPNAAQWDVHGKGNAQYYSMQPPPQLYRHEQHFSMNPSQQQYKQDEGEQRICPKCHQVCPDLDTLQIHVMECLDK